MDKEMILTPEELYYMGRFLQAKYIDYAYVAAMGDIGHNFAMFEKETGNSLVASGILTEDFAGNIEIDQKALAVLKPIFFGESETSLDICSISEKSSVSVCKFHFYDGAITMVTGFEGKLLIKAVDQTEIKALVEKVLPQDYSAQAGDVIELTEKTVTRFIAVKSIFVGKKSVVKTYIEADGIFYRENGDKIESVNREMFVCDVYGIVKGV